MANRFRARYAASDPRPMVLAHRGDSSRAPENTLEAARLGHRSGADGWELDVRLTRDGVPVVLHDESLLRTTDVALRHAGDPRGDSGFLVGEFLLEEVRALDAGSWFVDPEGGPRSAEGFGSAHRLDGPDRAHYASGRVQVPTLREALELTVGLDWLVNVEIKPVPGDFGGLVEAVLAEIRRAGASDRVAVSSFDLSLLARVAAIEPGVATGALISGPIDRPPAAWLEAVGADAIHAPIEGLAAIGDAARRGRVPVLIYTVNDPSPSGPATRLAEAGVAGWFTDDPEGFARGKCLRHDAGERGKPLSLAGSGLLQVDGPSSVDRRAVPARSVDTEGAPDPVGMRLGVLRAIDQAGPLLGRPDHDRGRVAVN